MAEHRTPQRLPVTFNLEPQTLANLRALAAEEERSLSAQLS
jgi:hypothetical protein